VNGMGSVLLMIMNYFHDLAVAVLAANILVVFFLGKFLERRQADPSLMRHLFRRLSAVTYGALAFVVLAGAVRAYFFADFEWNPAVARGQVEALVIKHVVLVAVTIFGIAGQIKYRKKYGR